jgi:hypothetical protein
MRATSRSARANRNAPGSLEARDRVAREAFLLSRRGLNFGVPPGAYRAAIVQMRLQESTAVASAALDATDSAQAAAALSWNALGPLPLINEIPSFGGVALGGPLAGATGRVTAVVADPTLIGRMFVGTGDGGVWMRANATAAFVPIFELEPTLSVGALALDTTTSPNPTLYVGSGEGNGSADSYYGEGVFVSSDLGNTWTQLGASNFAHASIASIAVDTTQTPRTIYAAVTYGSSASRADASWVEGDFSQDGLWRSADGGESWIPYPAGTFGPCPYFTNDPCPAESVVIDAASPAAVLVSILGAGVFRSSNSGFSWTPASLPNLSGGVGRASVAAADGVAYAIVGAADGIEFAGFYKSANDGVSWTQASVPSAAVGGATIDGSSSSNFSESFFDQTLAIDPADTTGATVVFGGVGIYRSINSGSNWTSLAPSGGTHSDQHGIAFDPASAHSFYLGNDGGLYRFDAGTLAWTAFNTSISAAQAQSVVLIQPTAPWRLRDFRTTAPRSSTLGNRRRRAGQRWITSTADSRSSTRSIRCSLIIRSRPPRPDHESRARPTAESISILPLRARRCRPRWRRWAMAAQPTIRRSRAIRRLPSGCCLARIRFTCRMTRWRHGRRKPLRI